MEYKKKHILVRTLGISPQLYQ